MYRIGEDDIAHEGWQEGGNFTQAVGVAVVFSLPMWWLLATGRFATAGLIAVLFAAGALVVEVCTGDIEDPELPQLSDEQIRRFLRDGEDHE